MCLASVPAASNSRKTSAFVWTDASSASGFQVLLSGNGGLVPRVLPRGAVLRHFGHAANRVVTCF